MEPPDARERLGNEGAGEPPPSEGAPARRSARERRAQHERDELARHQAAVEQADLLIRGARDATSNARSALGEVVRRVADVLALEQCDLLILQSADRGLLVQVRVPRANESTVASAGDTEGTPAGPSVRFRSLRIAPTDSPIAMLHGEGDTTRVHVFLHHDVSLRPLGVLSVGIALHDRFTIEQRVVMNAIGDRLATAIARGDFSRAT